MTGLFLLVVCLSCTRESKDIRIEKIDQWLNGQAQFYKFNGNVLVAEKGKVIYQRSFGVADFETKRSLNDSSVFELASVSKQFTAAGILLLEKEGKLALTDSLKKFFPGLPYSGITIHHMLTHTSGLPDYEAAMGEKWDRSKIASNNDMIEFLQRERTPAEFLPGAKWEYSNTGYAILASIIEQVSGETLRNFLAKRIFEPLEMKHSRIYNTRRTGEKLENYAFGYVWSDSLSRFVLPDSLPDYSYVFYLDGIQGDGVVNSTTGDLLKWDRAMAQQTLLGESVVKMVTPHALSDTATNRYYGYGLFVGKDKLGNYIEHSGGWPGYSTNLARYVDQDLTIIVLSNNQSQSTQMKDAIAAALFDKPLIMPYKHKPVPLDSVAMDQWVGSYSVEGWKFKIAREEKQLTMVFDFGLRVKLSPESETKVFASDYDLQFEMEESNGQKNFFRIQYGVKDPLEKAN